MSTFLYSGSSCFRRVAPDKSRSRENASGEKALDNSCQQLPLPCQGHPAGMGTDSCVFAVPWCWAGQPALFGIWMASSAWAHSFHQGAFIGTGSAHALPRLYIEKPKVKSKAEEPGDDEAVLQHSIKSGISCTAPLGLAAVTQTRQTALMSSAAFIQHKEDAPERAALCASVPHDMQFAKWS